MRTEVTAHKLISVYKNVRIACHDDQINRSQVIDSLLYCKNSAHQWNILSNQIFFYSLQELFLRGLLFINFSSLFNNVKITYENKELATIKLKRELNV